MNQPEQRFHPLEQYIPAHWTHATVEANGAQQHYYRTGGAKPALVLVHGFMMTGLYWLRVAKELEAKYDVIMPDARGHGQTRGSLSQLSLDLYAADLAGMIHALALQQPLVVGHSNGANIAAQAAAHDPSLMRGLVLIDPPLHIAMPPEAEQSPAYRAWRRSWLDWMRTLRTLPPDQRVAAVFDRWPQGFPAWQAEELLAVAEAHAQLDLDLLERATMRTFLPDWHAIMPRIACPILLLTSAGYVPEIVESLSAIWRQGTHIHVAETSHFIDRERFDACIAAIRSIDLPHTQEERRTDAA